LLVIQRAEEEEEQADPLLHDEMQCVYEAFI
jgi:hypothetical protein